MGRQTLLDLLDLLSLSAQLRHQANLGVPQRNDPSIHLSLLLTDLVGWTELLNESAMHISKVLSSIINLLFIFYLNDLLYTLKKQQHSKTQRS